MTPSPRLVYAAALAVVLLAYGPDAHAGAIGWADAVGEFATEGVGAGVLITVLGVVAVGAVLAFGITGLLTTVIMFSLGGALMSNADAVAAALFGAGAGGGSLSQAVAWVAT